MELAAAAAAAVVGVGGSCHPFVPDCWNLHEDCVGERRRLLWSCLVQNHSSVKKKKDIKEVELNLRMNLNILWQHLAHQLCCTY